MTSHAGIVLIAGAAVVLGLILASCAPNPRETTSGAAGYDAEQLCSRVGFSPGTEAFASCTAKLDGLAQQQAENRKQCEGFRQRPLSGPYSSGGIGNTIATSDADYQNCMSGALTPPVQLVSPTGRTLTCRMIQQQIACD